MLEMAESPRRRQAGCRILTVMSSASAQPRRRGPPLQHLARLRDGAEVQIDKLAGALVALIRPDRRCDLRVAVRAHRRTGRRAPSSAWRSWASGSVGPVDHRSRRNRIQCRVGGALGSAIVMTLLTLVVLLAAARDGSADSAQGQDYHAVGLDRTLVGQLQRVVRGAALGEEPEPCPTTTGKTISRYSSTRSCSISAWIRVFEPVDV